jgi:hypothetical protein
VSEGSGRGGWRRPAARVLARAAGGLLAAALALGACGPAAPPPLTRVSSWSPQGAGVASDAVAAIELSGEVGPEGIVDGRRVALARAAQVRAVATAVESADGLGAGSPALACAVALSADGRRIELRPLAPLAAGTVHALVLGPIRDAGGRPVLDAEGRRRTFVGTFETAPGAPGPPPRPVITEVRAVAASPQAGGEYVEVQNRGLGPLDLFGWRLEKRTASGAVAGCDLVTADAEPLAAGAYALLTGDAWDGRYGLPAVPRATCGTASLLGGLADDRPPEVRLLDPAGQVQSTLGQDGVAPRCPAAVERIEPDGLDSALNLSCADGGTPGGCNAATPVANCH